MKKFMFFAAFFSLLVGSIVFSACAKTSVSASDFNFTYERNSAQKVSKDGKEYVLIKLDVKNISSSENELVASKFTLQNEDGSLGSEVFFGNNIIDKMTSEILQPNETESVIINILVNSPVSNCALFFDQTEITKIRID